MQLNKNQIETIETIKTLQNIEHIAWEKAQNLRLALQQELNIDYSQYLQIKRELEK